MLFTIRICTKEKKYSINLNDIIREKYEALYTVFFVALYSFLFTKF